jgi:hypothetical protein
MIENAGEMELKREETSHNRALLAVFLFFETWRFWILSSYDT